MVCLTDRQALVLSLYYGFRGYEPLDLSTIAKELKITRERTRQIKDGALVKLNQVR